MLDVNYFLQNYFVNGARSLFPKFISFES